MRGIIQRVREARVISDGMESGAIARGLLIYACCAPGDSAATAELFARKCAQARIFSDPAGKLNRSVLDEGGSVLLVPNFTLYAKYEKGSRPQFSSGIAYEAARDLFALLEREFARYLLVGTGVFGSHMEVRSTADGPLNLIVDV